jgi:hypothetical protein
MQELRRPDQVQSRRCVEATRARPTPVRRPPTMVGPPTHARRFGFSLSVLILVVIGLILPGCHCFTAPSIHRKSYVGRSNADGVNLLQESAASSDGTSAQSSDELIARRITVVGDVGGYYRACVINEVRCGVFVIMLSTLVFSSSSRRLDWLLIHQASRFRRLVGTMSPPDGVTKKAEIYVEGKRDKVEGFVRWCERSKVGLGQSIRVECVVDEEPTGLYEGFYAYTE